VTLYSGRNFETFGGIFYGGSGFLQNIDKLLPYFMVSHCRRQQSS